MPLTCNASSCEVEEDNTGSFQASPCLKTDEILTTTTTTTKAFNVGGINCIYFLNVLWQKKKKKSSVKRCFLSLLEIYVFVFQNVGYQGT